MKRQIHSVDVSPLLTAALFGAATQRTFSVVPELADAQVQRPAQLRRPRQVQLEDLERQAVPVARIAVPLHPPSEPSKKNDNSVSGCHPQTGLL